MIHNLCVGLDRLGHEVHLVTVGDSTTPVRRSAVFDTPPGEIGDPITEIVHVRAAYALLDDVDVIHDHTTIGPQFLAEKTGGIPVVTTVHGPFTQQLRMMHATLPPGVALIAISHAQRAAAPELDVAAVIHHGIDLDVHGPGPGGGGYLMFIGRMSPDKGPDRAIEVARRTGLRLVMAAKMREPAELAYFDEHVRPVLGPYVEFIGEADADTRLDLLRHAEALVNPIRWPEPFGLVMAESLACATPVITLRHGAAPEIVDDGVTGFLCDDLDEMVAAVGQLGDIDRAACRAAAVERLSLERMAADHVALYERLVARSALSAGTVTPFDAGRSRRRPMLRRRPSASHATAGNSAADPMEDPMEDPMADPVAEG
jgi:glycosyltransferase involved in cell wall biosynthesis